MEHPLLKATYNQTHCMPHLDHIDPVPSHDSAICNAAGNPIKLTYEPGYIPSSYERYPITPSVTTGQFISAYKPLAVRPPELKDEIQRVVDYYQSSNALEILQSFDIYKHLLVLEALNIWLLCNGRWLVYRPNVHDSFRYSFPSYVFVLTKEDTDFKPPTQCKKTGNKRTRTQIQQQQQQEEEEDEKQKQEMSMWTTIQQVLTRLDVGIESKEINAIFHYRMRNMLSRSRFSSWAFTDVSTTSCKYDVHGINKSMRTVNILCPSNQNGTFWCHCYFAPYEFIWKNNDARQSNLNMIACYLNFPLILKLHRSIQKQPFVPVLQQKKKRVRRRRRRSSSSSSSSSSETAAAASAATATATTDEYSVARTTFDDPRLLHPTKVRYTYYIRNGMVYATSLTNSVKFGHHCIWDAESITDAYWNWVYDLYCNLGTSVVRYHMYYDIQSRSRSLQSGPNMSIKTNSIIPPNEGQLVSVKSQTTTDYFIRNSKIKNEYETVYLLNWLRADGFPDAFHECFDALMVICDSLTEVLLNVRAYASILYDDDDGPCMSLLQLKESCRRARQYRIDYIYHFPQDDVSSTNRCLVNWLNKPNDDDLYTAAKTLISTHHSISNWNSFTQAQQSMIQTELDGLLHSYTYNSSRARQYSPVVIHIQLNPNSMFKTLERPYFNGLCEYLALCRLLIKKYIIIPLVQAWYIYNPCIDDTHRPAPPPPNSLLAHIRQLIVAEVQSPSFQHALQSTITTRTTNREDMDLLLAIGKAMKGELSQDNLLLTRIADIERKSEKSSSSSFYVECKLRISSMIIYRNQLDPTILLDILDKMSYSLSLADVNACKYIVNVIEHIVRETDNQLIRDSIRVFVRTGRHHTDKFIQTLADSLAHV